MEVLHRLGCSTMQGFLFCKALPPDELENWLLQTVLPRKAPWIGQIEDTELTSQMPIFGMRGLPSGGSGG
jgi:hypothetical protein